MMEFLKTLREVHLKKIQNNPRDKPAGVWLEDELFAWKKVKALTIVLRTAGCSWAKTGGCTMCGYIYDAIPVLSPKGLEAQIQTAMEKFSPQVKVVKLFTSGSFLDPKEVPAEARNQILAAIGEKVEKVIVESRPEFVKREVVLECVNLVKQLEIAIGLETSSDTIRMENINKGFTFKDFIQAAKIARECGAAVKAYLLLKPPFLSERAAIEDAIKSIKDIEDIEDAACCVNTISINLCNVQRGTLVHELFVNKSYRSPWLWSAVEVLKKGRAILSRGKIIMCDPVAAGFKRGPHNCGKCDRAIAASIKEFSLNQDVEIFNNLYCECLEIWRKVLEIEDYTFGAPLF
jgi:radical SAM enzyme (TIGR01210 family)